MDVVALLLIYIFILFITDAGEISASQKPEFSLNDRL